MIWSPRERCYSAPSRQSRGKKAAEFVATCLQSLPPRSSISGGWPFIGKMSDSKKTARSISFQYLIALSSFKDWGGHDISRFTCTARNKMRAQTHELCTRERRVSTDNICAGLLPIGPSPVSYTHLRAHETYQDLV